MNTERAARLHAARAQKQDAPDKAARKAASAALTAVVREHEGNTLRLARELEDLTGLESRLTILFVDEAHRFNKAQQDAFLPYVEDGTIIFIGATTENPSFELNNALLSRARVYVLKMLDEQALHEILQFADITRPGITVDLGSGLFSKAPEGTPVFIAKGFKKMVSKQ